MMRRFFPACLAAWLTLVGTSCYAGGGEELFASRCASCHAVQQADGDKWLAMYRKTGPDLASAGTKFAPGYLESWLQNPTPISAAYPYFRHTRPSAAGDRLVTEDAAPHPALHGGELDAIVAYLGTLQAPIQPFPSAAPNRVISGQVLVDKVLACSSCHQTATGQPPHSGPSLVGVGKRLSDLWLRSYVHDPQQWGVLTMPRASIRADQLAAAVDYLDGDAAPAAPSAAGAPAAGALRPQPALDTANRPALLYRMLCTQCHGLEGNGKGINAPYLSVEPRNHRDYETMHKLSDEHLFQVIRYGGASVGKSALMPAWGSVLREDDIKSLIPYLRQLSQTPMESQ